MKISLFFYFIFLLNPIFSQNSETPLEVHIDSIPSVIRIEPGENERETWWYYVGSRGEIFEGYMVDPDRGQTYAFELDGTTYLGEVGLSLPYEDTFWEISPALAAKSIRLRFALVDNTPEIIINVYGRKEQFLLGRFYVSVLPDTINMAEINFDEYFGETRIGRLTFNPEVMQKAVIYQLVSETRVDY